MSGGGGDTIWENLEEFDVEKSTSSKYLVKKSFSQKVFYKNVWSKSHNRVEGFLKLLLDIPDRRRYGGVRRAGEGDLSGD